MKKQISFAFASFGLVLVSSVLTGCGGGNESSTGSPQQSSLAITTASLPSGNDGIQYSVGINSNASSLTGGETWSVSTGLPQGLTFPAPGMACSGSASCGIGGTPTAQGTFSFTVTVRDTTGASASRKYSIVIGPPLPLNITTTSPLPDGIANDGYSFQLGATGGVQPYTWGLSPGSALPNNVTLTSSGTISGALTATGTITFSVTVSDAETPAQTASASLSLSIHALSFGQYTFLFNGFDANGAVAAAGSFTVDDTGNITSGVEDINRHVPGPAANVPITGTYSVGSGNRGTFTLTSSLGTSSFEVNSGRFVEFDSSGTRGSGIIRNPVPSACTLDTINGDFAFGGAGEDVSNSRVAIAGRFHADGAGNFSSGALDENAAGTLASNVAWTGTYTAPASSSPRCSAMFTPTGLPALNFALYPVSSLEAFLVEVDPVASKVPLISSRALAQDVNVTAPNSTLALLSGASAGDLTGFSPSANAPFAELVYLNSDGAGSATLTSYENKGGIVTSTWNQGSYNVAPNGRTTLTTGVNSPVLYLAGSDAFAVGTDDTATFGLLVGNPGTDYGPSNATLSGTFALSTDASTSAKVNDLFGTATFDGAGALTATWDASGQTGNVSNQAFAGTYSVTNDPVDGYGSFTITPAGGPPANFIFLMLFGTKCVRQGYGGPTICSPTSAFEVVAIPSDATQTKPSVLIIEQ